MYTFDGLWHATPNNVARSRRALLASLREEELSEEILDSIGVAVTEVTTNTVYHAYVGRRIGQFRITATIRSHEVNVSVDDDGCGFDTETAGSGRPRSRSRSLGRGTRGIEQPPGRRHRHRDVLRAPAIALALMRTDWSDGGPLPALRR